MHSVVGDHDHRGIFRQALEQSSDSPIDEAVIIGPSA
jgi:hypothetical protein